MKLLIVAPHQDDEILGACGLIQKCRHRGVDISVLFATNGDRFGFDIAQQRYDESRRALAELGVSEDHIFYMGFGDTGMSFERSFLMRLRVLPDNQSAASYVSSRTYHPASGRTVRVLRTGNEGDMKRESFLSDLKWIIENRCPDFVLGPSVWDRHGDHAALATFLKEVLPSSIPYTSYLIHGGDDTCWPQREPEVFEKPPVLPQHIWAQRITTRLSEEQQREKRRLIMYFATQIKNDAKGFLTSFAKQEELFFPETTSSANSKDIFLMEIR